MMTFREFMLELAPPWLRTPSGEAWTQANGDMKDSLLDQAKQAVLSRFIASASADALGLIGAERQLFKRPSTSSDTYRQQLLAAWDAWPWAGTAKGVLNALRDAGYPGTQLVIAKGLLYSLDLSTQELTVTDLHYATVATYWSSFFLYFPSASFPAGWSGTPPASSSDEAKFIINLVLKWKSAHARFDRVVLNMGGSIWGLSTWGGTTWGGTAPVVWEGPF